MTDVNYVNTLFVSFAAASALTLMPSASHAAAAPTIFPTFADVQWSADGGIPVELADGAVLYLFGDTVKPGSFTNNSAVIVGGGFTVPLWDGDGLLVGTDDSWFWPADAVEQADGSLLVIANEVRKDDTSWFGFASFDTDMFVITDPYSVMSWRLAEHIDAGPWDGLNVSLLNATQAAVRPLGSDVTYLADLTTADWDRVPMYDGDSDGTLVPVEFGGAWWAVEWDMAAGDVVLLRSDTLEVGSWVAVTSWQAEPDSYGHQLHLVDGRVVYVHSVPGNGYELGESTAFPVYEDVTNRLV